MIIFVYLIGMFNIALAHLLNLIMNEHIIRYFLEPKGNAQAKKAAEAEEKRLAAIEAKQEAAERSAELARQRKEEAEEKRQAAAEAAQFKKEQQEAKRAEAAEAAQLKKEEQEAKRAEAAQAKAAQAEQTVKQAKPGATISLFGFGQKKSEDDEPAAGGGTTKQKSGKVLSAAPRGVPTISNWKENRDGSVSGFIFGSPNFEEGESVTTSALIIDAADGIVVQTGSGSR